MDDGLVLNLVEDSQTSYGKKVHGKKTGRWTDRVKEKRVAKRKIRTVEGKRTSIANQSIDDDKVEHRPAKRPRTNNASLRPSADVGPKGPPTSKTPLQIISSLFTSNPRVDTPKPQTSKKVPAKPSNAPLTDASTFSGLGLDPLLVAHLSTKLDISKPTSIQRAALPLLLGSASGDVAERDAFIQSQTGSGKTLSYLLPIIQDLLPLSTHSYIDRSIGTLAIIIAPTRELAKQISDVLEALLRLRLRPEGESADDTESSTRLTRWLISGLLSGGATRTHEKARLRKGIPILVSTPGRLLDHLQNTSSFNVGKCRWLILDEADQLMELGFEQTIHGIIHGLDGRRRLARQAVEEGRSMEVGGWDWERRRRTVLCSATIREDVQKLAGTALVRPLVIKALEADHLHNSQISKSQTDGATVGSSANFTPPSQLSQKYIVVPLKLRLVTLIALLRSLLAQTHGRKGIKIIVFFSCTDSVDFHWNLLGNSTMGQNQAPVKLDATEKESGFGSDSDESDFGVEAKSGDQPEKIAVTSNLLPHTSIYRLHGSLPTPIRHASLREFSVKPKQSNLSSVLFCTSVASRGLDLPLVRAVIQYDLPTEGGATEYVHRVGRTARAGGGGEAWNFVAPSEAEWVKWVEGKMCGDKTEAADSGDEVKSLEPLAMNNVLSSGFGGQGSECEERATEVQLSFERWVFRNKENSDLARRAYLSHMRAYATHPSDEKHIFHIRHLHLGHLAKAFALREAPKTVTSSGKNHTRAGMAARSQGTKARTKNYIGEHHGEDMKDAEQRMQEVVRAQGRLSRKGGLMVSSGTSEFQIASGGALEKLVQGYKT